MEKLIETWVAALNRADVTGLQDVFCDSFVWEDVALRSTLRDKEAFPEFLSAWFGAVPDFRVTVQRVIVAGDDTAFIQWTWTGTQEGPLPPDLPPTGRRFTCRGASLCHARDGRIAALHDYWDALGMRTQLGHLPRETGATSRQRGQRP